MAAMWTSGGHELLPLLLLPLLLSLAGGEHTDCSSLHCLHDSPCLTTVSHGNRHPTPAHARCLCRGHWAGPRCQYRIHVTAAQVTSHAVHLQVAMVDSLTSSPAGDGPGAEESTSRPEAAGKGEHSGQQQQDWHQSYLSSTNTQVRQGGLVSAAQYRMSNYTITYWSNSSQRTCRLLQELTSLSPSIHGLQPNSLYLFCAESGSLDSCAPSAADVTSDDTNCVKVVTPAASDLDDLDPEPEVRAQEEWQDVPTVVVVTVATVVLVVVVLAAVLVFRWFHLLTVRQLCSLCCHRNKEVASFERFHREALDSDHQQQERLQDLEYYTARAMPLPPAVDFPPPSPDLSLHGRSGGGGVGGRRARGGGLGGRSLGHRVTLEAVLEDPAGDCGDVTETSLMVEPGQEGSDCRPGDVTEASPMMAACDDVRETSLMIPACDDVRETSLMMPGCDDVSVLPSAYTSPIMRHDMVT